jgi:hypothetical protein
LIDKEKVEDGEDGCEQLDRIHLGGVRLIRNALISIKYSGVFQRPLLLSTPPPLSTGAGVSTSNINIIAAVAVDTTIKITSPA